MHLFKIKNRIHHSNQIYQILYINKVWPCIQMLCIHTYSCLLQLIPLNRHGKTYSMYGHYDSRVVLWVWLWDTVVVVLKQFVPGDWPCVDIVALGSCVCGVIASALVPSASSLLSSQCFLEGIIPGHWIYSSPCHFVCLLCLTLLTLQCTYCRNARTFSLNG